MLNKLIWTGSANSMNAVCLTFFTDRQIAEIPTLAGICGVAPHPSPVRGGVAAECVVPQRGVLCGGPRLTGQTAGCGAPSTGVVFPFI